MTPRVLSAGVDSLTVTRTVDLPPRNFDVLDALRESARQAREAGSVLPSLNLEGQLFEVQPSANFPFRHLLRSPDVILTVAKRNGEGRPTVRAEVPQQALWTFGPDGAYQRAAKFLDLLATQDLETGEVFPRPLTVERIARVDLCVDVQGWSPRGTDRECRRFVCRARIGKRQPIDRGGRGSAHAPTAPEGPIYVQTHGQPGDSFTGYEWARGQPLMVRLYAKSVEIARSGKDWMRSVWERAEGYDPELPVWRLEAQFRREALHEFGVDEAFPLANLDKLWMYAVGSPRPLPSGETFPGWLSFRQPTLDSNRSRWPVSATWRSLQSVRFRREAHPAVRQRKITSDIHRAVGQLRGHFALIGDVLVGEQIRPELLQKVIDQFVILLNERECAEALAHAQGKKRKPRPFTAKVARRRALAILAEVIDHEVVTGKQVLERSIALFRAELAHREKREVSERRFAGKVARRRLFGRRIEL